MCAWTHVRLQTAPGHKCANQERCVVCMQLCGQEAEELVLNARTNSTQFFQQTFLPGTYNLNAISILVSICHAMSLRHTPAFQQWLHNSGYQEARMLLNTTHVLRHSLQHKETAMCGAARAGNVEILRLLLAKGAKTDQPDTVSPSLFCL